VIKYKIGSEIAADFLSSLTIDAEGIFYGNWKLEQEQDECYQ
jgi:hypothetical protein